MARVDVLRTMTLRDLCDAAHVMENLELWQQSHSSPTSDLKALRQDLAQALVAKAGLPEEATALTLQQVVYLAAALHHASIDDTAVWGRVHLAAAMHVGRPALTTEVASSATGQDPMLQQQGAALCSLERERAGSLERVLLQSLRRQPEMTASVLAATLCSAVEASAHDLPIRDR